MTAIIILKIMNLNYEFKFEFKLWIQILKKEAQKFNREYQDKLQVQFIN